MRWMAGVLMVTVLAGVPAAADEGAGDELDRAAFPPGTAIPVTGVGSPELESVVDAVVDFMRHRCVGAATLGIAYQGEPVGVWGLGRDRGRATQSVVNAACGDDLTDPYHPAASDVDQYTPMRIGSITKPITAAVLRWAIKNEFRLTDAELEAIPLFANALPEPLLPPELTDLYTGGPGSLPPEWAPLCNDLDGEADDRWNDVTVGHLLGHRAGLAKSGLNIGVSVMPRIPVLRGLDDQADLWTEHLATIASSPVGAPAAANAAVALGAGVRFIERPSLVEYLQVHAGRCLEVGSGGTATTVGDPVYSNLGPAYWTAIIEHLHRSQRFVARLGEPGSHLGSALHQFVLHELDMASTGSSGIFLYQGVPGLDPDDYSVPPGRGWSIPQQTYRPIQWDSRRNHCVVVAAGAADGDVVDDTCDFSDWLPGPRANWLYQPHRITFDLNSLDGWGSGRLAAEPLHMLRLMRDFWIAWYDMEPGPDEFDPAIGEPRDGEYLQQHRVHNGALAGYRAWAWQFGTEPVTFNAPIPFGDGTLIDPQYPGWLQSGSFVLPPGVDVFVAVNNSSDRSCRSNETWNASFPQATPRITCQQAYGLLDDYVAYGLSQVDWDAMAP